MTGTRETIRYEVQEGIALVTLDRPEKLNAISLTLRRELLDALVEAESDPAVGTSHQSS